MLVVHADPFDGRRQTTISTLPSGLDALILLLIMLIAYGVTCLVIVHHVHISSDAESIMPTEQG